MSKDQYELGKIKQLLINEKIEKLKRKKLIKLFIGFVIIVAVTSTLVYSGLVVYKNVKSNLIPIYSGKIGESDINTIWIGSFQIAWDELKNTIGKDIEFDIGESELLYELNNSIFKKDMISEDDYYVKIGETNSILKDDIVKDINNKFRNKPN